MKRIFLGIMVILVVAGGGYWAYAHYAAVPGPDAIAATASTQKQTQTYTNSVYNFSLKMPADYAASEIPSTDGSGGDTILLQNITGDGIQITVTPFDEDTGNGYTLTKERILQDLPDMNIQDEQPVPVAAGYTGISFITDDPTFGTSSRAVWFAYHGNLYQISTYARLDQVLQQIFSTWQWQ